MSQNTAAGGRDGLVAKLRRGFGTARGRLAQVDAYHAACGEAATEIERLTRECEALGDMLDDARVEAELVRDALGVPYEPHQALHERTVETARELLADSERLGFLLPIFTDGDDHGLGEAATEAICSQFGRGLSGIALIDAARASLSGRGGA